MDVRERSAEYSGQIKFKTWTSKRRRVATVLPRNQTPTAETARTRPANAGRQHPPSGTEMDTTWKKEAMTAKYDVATNSDGRAERDGAVMGCGSGLS